MCREFHRVMGEEGPSHTTLFRYAMGKVKRRNVLTERYVREAIQKVTVELVQKELSESETQRKRVLEELQQKEAKLLESEQLFRQIAENIQEVFFVVDHKDYRVLYVSPSYEKIWGQTCESLLKDPTAWIEAIIPEDRERVSAALENQQRTGEFNEEFRIARPDKSIRWIHDRVFPIRNAQGELYRLVGIALDITEHVRLEH